MNVVARTAVGLLGILAAVLLFRTIRTNAWFPMTVAFGSVEATAALIGLWFVVAGDNAGERDMIGRVLVGGAIVGGVAFAIGFFGPLIFTPGSNQGPLLGILLTGPLGFAAGCIASFLWLRVRHALAR